MCGRKFIFSTCVVWVVLISGSIGFNLSPQPNYVFKAPEINNLRPSLFGLAVTLREDSLMVGAPRANSTLSAQSDLIEPGVIYRCLFESKICYPFVFDATGNVPEPPGNKTADYRSAVKDNQWLGSAMDGFGASNSSFVACGYRYKADSLTEHTSYYLHGVCYVTQSTKTTEPVDLVKLNAYKARDLKSDNPSCPFNGVFSQMGFSVHMTDTQEILMGAPGVCQHRGTLVRAQKLSNKLKTTEHLTYLEEPISPRILKTDKIIVPQEAYFGYAMTSGFLWGPGNSKLVYVASAPRGDKKQGAVYLFDFQLVANKPRKQTYKMLATQVVGEFFGYAVITEDFDGDGWPDLAISAPLHSHTGEFENGKVYIWKNKGKLNFDVDKELSSSYEGNGRFGLALGQIGDINRDGYNDLAVGAPYEGYGAVYIYLGSSSGVSFSQKISAPVSFASDYAGLFGHSISRGVDLDHNSFKDVAVGSPETDTVFVYKAYPTVQIIAKVTPSQLEVEKNNVTHFNLTFSWQYKQIPNFEADFDFGISLVVDSKLKRVQFSNGNFTKDLNVTINSRKQTETLRLKVSYEQQHLIKPITIELHYDFLQKVPENSTTFCKTCVAIHPNDPKVVRSRVAFKTDCTAAVCVADLILDYIIYEVDYQPALTVGASSRMTVEYRVQNVQETAYLPQLKIRFPSFVTVTKSSKKCNVDEEGLTCDLGTALQKDVTAKQNITFDITNLEGYELQINATAVTASDENNDDDNIINKVIPLRRHSQIDLIGKSVTQQLFLDDMVTEKKIVHRFEVKNRGPTKIDELEVRLYLPQTYQRSLISDTIFLFNVSSINVTVTYKTEAVAVGWKQNGKDLFLGLAPDQLDDETPSESLKVSKKTVAEPQVSLLDKKSPQIRRIMLNCSAEQPTHSCIQGSFNVRNVWANADVIEITIEYLFGLEELKKLLKNEHEIFVFQTSAEVNILDPKATHEVLYRPANTELYHHSLETAWWIYVLSIVIGLIVLLLISLLFQRCGFFRREKKDEMEMYRYDLEKTQPLALNEFAFREEYTNMDLCSDDTKS